MAALEVLGEVDVVLERGQVERPVASAADDHVLLDRVDDVEQRRQVELRLDLLLQRLQEQLLTRDAVEIRVEVAVADEGERVVAAEPLVARP